MPPLSRIASAHPGPRAPVAAWQAWLARHVPVQARPLVDPGRRLVVVAPHPDDEVLACALLMQQHAAGGGAVHVVAVTDGEASHAHGDWDPRAPHQQRTHERSEGLARLRLKGVAVTSLHLPDGAVAEAGSRLHAALLALLTPADAIVTTWRQDGHPDHECCGRVALDVTRRLRIPLLQAPVSMWHWAEPGDSAIAWHHLRALEAPACDRLCKAAALHAHQLRLMAHPALPPAAPQDGVLERALWPREYFFIED